MDIMDPAVLFVCLHDLLERCFTIIVMNVKTYQAGSRGPAQQSLKMQDLGKLRRRSDGMRSLNLLQKLERAKREMEMEEGNAS